MIQKLAAEAGSSSRIFKAIADPPTTSLQRLKVATITFTVSVSFRVGAAASLVMQGIS